MHTSRAALGGESLRGDRAIDIQRVSSMLRAEIQDGAYPDRRLPDEEALMRAFQTSRGVVREALASLHQQGVVHRIRGVGTFAVSSVLLAHNIGDATDLAQELNAANPRVTIRKLSVTTHETTPFVAGKLEIGPHERVVTVESLTILDGYPLSIRTAFLPASSFAVLETDVHFDFNRSPYTWMASLIDEPIGVTELRISASIADSRAAELLTVQPGIALIEATRIVRAASGRPLEYGILRSRAERFSYATTLQPRTGDR